MTDVMVSYSRIDKDFAYRLTDALDKTHVPNIPNEQLDIWIDKEDIGLGKSWWDRIKKGIEDANNIIVIYSDNYLASEVCNEELAYSLQLGKSVIPIWVTPQILPEAYHAKQEARQKTGDWSRNALSLADQHFTRLSQHNSLNGLFYDAGTDNLPFILEKVIDAILNDVDYKEGLTVWGNRALKWHSNNKASKYLLVGNEIEQAEQWRDTAIAKKQDVSRVAAFITASRVRRRQQQRIVFTTSMLALILMSILAVVSLFLYSESKINLDLANVRGTDVAIQFEQSESQRLAADARNALTENNQRLALTLGLAAQTLTDRPDAEVLRTFADTVYAPNARWVIQPSTQSTLSVDISPDNTIGAIASGDGSVRLITLKNGETLRQMVISTPNIIPTSLQFSPTEPVLAVAFTDGSIRLYATDTGAEDAILGKHDGIATVLTFDNSGQWLASGGTDKIIQLWDMTTRQLARALVGHTGAILSLAFDSEGTTLASGSSDANLASDPNDTVDRTVRLWDVASGESKRVIKPGVGYVRAIAFDPDPSVHELAVAVFSTTTGGTVRFYNSETGEPIDLLYASNDTISDIAYNQAGDVLYSTGRDGAVHEWDLDRWLEVATYKGFSESILSLDLSDDQQFLLIGQGNIGGDYGYLNDQSSDSQAILWDLVARDEVGEYSEHQDWLWAVDISSDGKWVATGGGPFNTSSQENPDTSIRIWNIQTMETRLVVQPHTATVGAVRFILNDSQLLSVGWDSRVIWTDLASGDVLWSISLDCGEIYTLDVRPQGDWFVVGCSDGSIHLGDVKTGEFMRHYPAHDGAVNDISFSADGTTFASGSDDKTVKIWDVDDSTHSLQVISGKTTIVYAVDYTPDGKLVVGEDNGTLSVWDLNTLTANRLIGHTNTVWGTAVSSDGSFLLSVSSDRTMRLWDLKTYQELYSYSGHNNFVQDVAIAPDNQIAVSVGQDQRAEVWVINPSGLALEAFARKTRYIRDLTCAERVVYGVQPLCPTETP